MLEEQAVIMKRMRERELEKAKKNEGKEKGEPKEGDQFIEIPIRLGEVEIPIRLGEVIYGDQAFPVEEGGRGRGQPWLPGAAPMIARRPVQRRARADHGHEP